MISKLSRLAGVAALGAAVVTSASGGSNAAEPGHLPSASTATPIKHLVVI